MGSCLGERGTLRSETDKERVGMMSSMGRSLLLLPLLLVMAEASRAQPAAVSSAAIAQVASSASSIDSSIAYWRRLRQGRVGQNVQR